MAPGNSKPRAWRWWMLRSPLLALLLVAAAAATTAAVAAAAAAPLAVNASAAASAAPPPPNATAPTATTTTTAATSPVVFGTLQVVAVHGPMVPGTVVEHEHQLFLSVRGSGEKRRLLFPAAAGAAAPARTPATGSLVMVRTAPMSRCVEAGTPVDGNPVCVQSMMVHEAGTVDGFALGQPRGEVQLKAIVFLLDVCGSGPAARPSDVERVLFADAPNAFPYTVQGMMRACSYGAANFTRALGTVVDPRPVPIPCSGHTPSGVFYDSKTCPYNEWSDVANAYIRNTLRINLDAYPHKIYVTPSGGVCKWGGMGYVGCRGDCRVWVSGDVWDRAATYAHELGHNLYLNHAGSKGDNGYGDFSATMGYCCDVRCYNPPHLWQMGWATAVAPALSAATLQPGTWERHLLPAQITTSRNYLRVRADWAQAGAYGGPYNLYFSYRKRLGYDSGLSVSRGFADKVAVYSARVGDPQPYTSHEGNLEPGTAWRETRLGSGLVVRFEGTEGNGARVAVCRPSPGQERRELACADGLDNDCDGLVDGDDVGDCGGGGGGAGGGGAGLAPPGSLAPPPGGGAGGGAAPPTVVEPKAWSWW